MKQRFTTIHKLILTMTFLLSSVLVMAEAQSKANELFLKAQELDTQHNYAEALEYYQKAKVEIVKENRKDSVVYANCLTNIGRCYTMLDDNRKAVEAWEESLPRYEKFSDRYNTVLEYMAYAYQDLGDTKNLSRMMALMEEVNQHELTLPCEEPGCMTERARYYASTGDNTKARECYLKALDMLSKVDDGSASFQEQKIDTYTHYAEFLGYNMNDHSNAAENYLSAANARKLIDGVSEKYINLVYSAGLHFYFGKQYQSAVDAYKIVLAYYEDFDSEEAKNNIAKCNKNMGNAYSALKDYENALKCYNINLQRQIEIGEVTEDYAKALERVATAEKFSRRYDSSIEHYRQSMAMYQQLGLTEQVSAVGNSLQLCYAYAGRSEQVETPAEETAALQTQRLEGLIKDETENLELTHTYLGELVYAQSLATIAGCYKLLEKYDQAVDYYELYMESVRKAISEEFSMEGEDERMHTWSKEKETMDEILEMMTTLPVGQEALMPRVAALAYDAELLSKGILLKSSIEFEQVLKKTRNKSLIETYETVKRNNETINNLRASASTDEDLERLLALKRQNEQMQMSIMAECSEFADYTNYLSYTWKDVQKSMKPTDIAIEFAAVEADVFDENNFMAAIVLTKDMEYPATLPACNLKQAKAMMQDSLLFETPVAGNIIWGSLLKQYLDGKKRILFSADGAFNHVAIEYLLYDGKPLSEQFDVYRLSSTKEICYRHAAGKIEKVAMFGDIEYYDEIAMSEATLSVLQKMNADGKVTRGSLEGRFIPLDGTQEELSEINRILKAADVGDIASLSGTQASEDAFLKLTDSEVNILHIATHGVSDADSQSSESESMQHCALAFAGANLHDGTDSINGLVTAAEIARMNLRECDLAVLSACESALGKISEDGVFGLQRGFKNAGVHSLLMSLKPVYDDSTTKLMITFYQGLVNGLSKREALVEAQKQLRTNPVFRTGDHWAPFILLDGLE